MSDRTSPYTTVKVKTNVPVSMTLMGVYFNAGGKTMTGRDGKSWVTKDQISLTGTVRGEKSRVYLPAWIGERMAEDGLIVAEVGTDQPDGTFEPKWSVPGPVPITISKDEDGTGHKWSVSRTGESPEPAGTRAQDAPSSPQTAPEPTTEPAPAPKGPQTDRRRVKAIRDTYAAAWQMAGEIMGEEIPEGPFGGKAGHPDQHAAAATLFIQMCRLDATMVWADPKPPREPGEEPTDAEG